MNSFRGKEMHLQYLELSFVVVPSMEGHSGLNKDSRGFYEDIHVAVLKKKKVCIIFILPTF